MKNYNDIFGEKDDISRIVNRVYDIGYDKARKELQIEEEFDEDRAKAIKEAYQKGLDDAWECVKKIAAVPSDGGFTGARLKLIFNRNYIADIVTNYSASETIAKIKEYEEKQKAEDEIKVGDEITDSSGNHGVVIALLEYDGDLRVLWLDGTVSITSMIYKKKTGRHFNIQGIFDQMKNEQ